MARNEKTSARVAKIAAKILSIEASPGSWGVLNHKTLEYEYIHWTDLRALAASALTQAPDKPRRRRPVDKARAAYREYVEATATSPDDRPKRKAKRKAKR